MSIEQDNRKRYDLDPTMLGFLCQTEARCELMDYILAEISNGRLEPRMTGQIMEDTELSRNSVTEHIGLFVEMKLLKASETQKKFTQYTPIEGNTYEVLQWLNDALQTVRGESINKGTAITHLYGSGSRRILVDFFTYLGMDYREEGIDPRDDPLTKRELYQKSGVTRKTIISEIDLLVEYGIVKEDTEFTYPRYYPHIDGPIFDEIVEANEMLIRAFNAS
jgi:hypothetical protein